MIFQVFLSLLRWGQQLNFHPHLHIALSGGGITHTGNFIETRHKGFLIPEKVIAKKWCPFIKETFNGNGNAISAQYETVGDLMGVLMVLCNSGILQISGERGENKLLKDDTVSIHLNPVLSSYLEIGYTTRGKVHTLSLQDALLKIRSYKVFIDLLKWEKMNYIYQSALKSAGDNLNEATQSAIDEIA